MNPIAGSLDQASREKLDFLKRVRAAEVDLPNAPPICREFVKFLDESCVTPAHYLRYCQTFLALIPYLTIVPGKVVLETGGFCDITRYLKTLGYECRKTSTDLRYAIDAEDESVDLLFSLEVIEHLKDQSESSMAEIVLFRGTGVRRYAAEIDRVLKPGGVLILTTPNPCSARALELLVGYQPPMVFRPHVREYSRSELLQFFSELQLLQAKTHYSFFNLSSRQQENWTTTFEKNGWDVRDRGDDQFLAFSKGSVRSVTEQLET